MTKELNDELKNHMEWLVRHLIKKGYSLKDVTDIIKNNVSAIRDEILTEMHTEQGFGITYAAFESGYSVGFVSILTTNYLNEKQRKQNETLQQK